ncbi:sigma-54 interaction domain-containing protein [Candidatus Endoriftia persephone]|jgi:transcriptional regulator with PAS, ATPase and Fis domain|uniref:Transcriptional regulatory protein ZraR n=3 Tax=Gammaproteobacteria TaxID=1236 RepID=G2FC74_9GAMM|nr:sigma 54-interacting transcriptional regulator [Candidatus Endoriftia persephone]EGV49763.1 transcriptional regulatory protein ZraR [endosymbiont of Riftia pachyptila (vent Ph05)]EGW55648.1 transcriptional regulatory protein ZraR [endosymbiont of Tevnia jerichonana (vent Tica)]USF86790.1 sigma 54-interacting transcriptional regulator [Candidatus Endoriftia persephone]
MHAIRQNLLGKAPEFLSVLRAMRIVAATDATVLVSGESGTGKELLASALHGCSRRSDGPFLTVNCAALPEQLVESELFGHRKGAFTGAVSDQPGRVQAAAGGTLFLDEISELPLSAQAKLLRFLESGECQAVGKAQPEVVDVRVVAATNRDLAQAVKEGSFRADLYYRLYIVPLELPALRHRSGDIDGLLQGLTDELAEQYKLAPPIYSKTAMKLLRRYSWPGNVRELKNLSERMLILFSDRIIRAENLPLEIREQSRLDGASGRDFVLPDDGLVLDELEANLIQQALGRTSGNRSKAARLLGLSRDTLLYRMKKYAIEL